MDIDLLIGEELTSVEFLSDQLVLHFDDNELTLYTWPIAADGDGVSLGFGEPGYRDALCFVLGLSVEKATYTEGSELTLEFDNGTVFAVSLREEDLNSPQAGTLSTLDGTFEF